VAPSSILQVNRMRSTSFSSYMFQPVKVRLVAIITGY
jgi:hypothetical protein